MIYRFIDNRGTFKVKGIKGHGLYFPLTNSQGSLLSSIAPNLSGDIKKDNERFLTPPASIEDLRSNLLCRREFFIRCKNKVLRLSDQADDSLEAGFLYHKITKKFPGLTAEITNFIPEGLAAEVMWIKLINTSRKPLEFTPISCIPLYGRGEKSLRDHRHVTSLLNRIRLSPYGIFLTPTMTFDEKRHRANATTYFCLGFEGNCRPPLGQFPTLDYFCGNGDLIAPDALTKNLKPAILADETCAGKEALAAFKFHKKTLKSNEETDYVLILGIEDSGTKSAHNIGRLFSKLDSLQKVTDSLKASRQYWQNYLSRLEINFGDKNFNSWLLWIKLQPTLRKLFGNSFLPHFDYGKGGRGWRDLWQDVLTLLLTQNPGAKKILLDGFKGIRIDGSNATIISRDGSFLSDRNSISRVWMDHGIWPYLALRLYIHATGDSKILLKNTPYFQDHQFFRSKVIDQKAYRSDYLLRTRSNAIYRGSILEHVLVQLLTSFFNVGMHNIIRLENADWNDGLDMAAKRGESVTFSSMYAYCLNDICFFLRQLKNKKVALTKELTLLLDTLRDPVDYDEPSQKQKRLRAYLKAAKSLSGQKSNIRIEDIVKDLQKKSGHLTAWIRKKEWLKEGFFNGYYDNKGKGVEGNSEGRIRLMLASQVFAIMSGVATSGQIKKIWKNIQKYLKDERLGGIRLNTRFREPYLNLGRAFGFSYGDKENGAFFNHMAIMLANALYQRGFIKEAEEVMTSMYLLATGPSSRIYPMIPEYYNSQGRGLYFYLTGSASWYIYTLIREVLGIKFMLGDLTLEPRLSGAGFLPRTVRINYAGRKKIIVAFINQTDKKKILKIKKVFLEDKKIPLQDNSCQITRKELQKISKKEIKIRAYLG
jgi:cellobiose phosphorylase